MNGKQKDELFQLLVGPIPEKMQGSLAHQHLEAEAAKEVSKLEPFIDRLLREATTEDPVTYDVEFDRNFVAGAIIGAPTAFSDAFQKEQTVQGFVV